MLDKLIINLKNIIFFKSIVYLLSITLLSILIPTLSEELYKANYNYEHAVKLLGQTTEKIGSVKKLDSNKQHLDLDYQELIKNSSYQGCLSRKELLNKIAELKTKFTLTEPLDVKISKIFLDDDLSSNILKKVKMNDYNITIKFSSQDLESLLKIHQSIYDLLPPGSVVSAAEIQKIDTLSPKTVEDLIASKTGADFFHSKLNIIIRQIVYDE